MYTFKKEERLCSRKLLDKLFNNGSSFLVYPFRVVSLPETSLPYSGQVVISVPKKRYKRAHDRNLIKRRVREAYRSLKADYLYLPLQASGIKLLISFQYVGKEIEDFSFIQKKLSMAMKQLIQTYNDNTKDT